MTSFKEFEDLCLPNAPTRMLKTIEGEDRGDDCSSSLFVTDSMSNLDLILLAEQAAEDGYIERYTLDENTLAKVKEMREKLSNPEWKTSITEIIEQYTAMSYDEFKNLPVARQNAMISLVKSKIEKAINEFIQKEKEITVSISDGRISFTRNEKEIMSMYFQADEFVWYFANSEKIHITKGMELYKPLQFIMKQNYQFASGEGLTEYKDDDKIVWHSDCYCDPDNERDMLSVSYLTIEKTDNGFCLYCTKPLDKINKRDDDYHYIIFSPSFNGRWAKNFKSGLSLQDEIIQRVYQVLLEKPKQYSKKGDLNGNKQ